MATATKTSSKSTLTCNPPERLAAILKSKQSRYMGVCVVNASGGWTRVGPTWQIDGYGWVVWGPGAQRWGTTEGLAQLASGTGMKTQWHAAGWASSPAPHLVFSMEPQALGDPAMKDVRAFGQAAEEFVQ